MATNTRIEWTSATWNPVSGCDKISDGCRNCYAERMARRLKAMGVSNYRNGFSVTLHKHMIEYPLTIKKPNMIFVNSMSDLFHEKVPDEFILEIFNVMKSAHWHTFQLLTKRSDRLLQMNKIIDWPDNVWMGVTVESNQYAHRIKDLARTSAQIKFLSLEPLLGPVDVKFLQGIDWIIVGGESGPGARPVKEEWIINIRNKCINENIHFFFKQWGGFFKKKSGRILEGRTWDDMPVIYKPQLAAM